MGFGVSHPSESDRGAVFVQYFVFRKLDISHIFHPSLMPNLTESRTENSRKIEKDPPAERMRRLYHQAEVSPP